MARQSRTKPWRCAAGHVLGLAMRNGRGITQLLLYRQAVDLAAAEPVEVDVLATVEGLVMDVRCGICGAIRTWTPAPDEEVAMNTMLQIWNRQGIRRMPWDQG